ncbi:MAG: hypothetical protein F4X92_01880 [Gammaproteobacteria bacterium]|nr:hypothetical protein [Gammaproteobacteria bacterium]
MRGLRSHCQRRLGERRHGPWHCSLCRGDLASLVAADELRPYPDATRLLITAVGGGSNGNRSRLWKREL